MPRSIDGCDSRHDLLARFYECGPICQSCACAHEQVAVVEPNVAYPLALHPEGRIRPHQTHSARVQNRPTVLNQAANVVRMPVSEHHDVDNVRTDAEFLQA